MKRRKAEQLALKWQDGNGELKFRDEVTDDVIASPSKKWFCGFIAEGLPSLKIVYHAIVSTPGGPALRFTGGFPHIRALSDRGTLAVVEEGSGSHFRLRIMFADGRAAIGPRIKDLIAAESLSISADDATLTVLWADGRFREVALASLAAKPLKDAVIPANRGCASMAVALLLTTLLLLLSAKLANRRLHGGSHQFAASGPLIFSR